MSKRKQQMNFGQLTIMWCIFILVTNFILACSEKMEPMDPWETEMAKQLEAENIQLSHFSTSKTVNGISAGSESYLQLDVLNSKKLQKVSHNKRLVTKKYDEIKDVVLMRPEISEFPAFNELRINVIATSGVSIFKSEKINTTTLRVH